MKKYFLIWTVVFFLCLPICRGADFGDLLSRLDSRDFTAEKDVLSGVGGPYVGETTNPHADTVMFKARDEFRALMSQALGSEEKEAELAAFVQEAVTKDVSVETKVWLLHRLEAFGTAGDVPALTGLLTGEEPRLVDAAAFALAKIPGDEAQKALEDHKAIPAAAAALTSRMTAAPPRFPVENALPMSLANLPQDKVDDYLAGYDSLTVEEKVRALASLTARDDKQFRPLAVAAMKSDSPELQKAGFLAMEKMATAEDVDSILAHLESDHDLTVSLCGFIVADGFDDALRARLDKAADTKRYLDLATILIHRAVDIRADVFKRTTVAECPDRLTLLQKVCEIATADDVPELVASTVRIPRGADRDAAENLIAGVCRGDAAPIIKLLGRYPAAVIYPMMCRTGGEAAQAELSKGLESKDAKTKEAALRALPTWADAALAETMMTMLTSGDCPESQFTPILRAYIRVVSLPDDKIGVAMTRDEKLENLKKAYGLAKRVDEKKLILSRLAANRTVKSLEFALACASDPETADAAYEAIADHAHDTALRKQYPDIMLKAINLVLEKSGDKALLERVEIYKGRME